MPWEYIPHHEEDVGGSLMVVGLPSVGLSGTIAAAFLVDHLEMKMLGAYQHTDLPPVGIVREGLVSAPIQVWTTPLVCGLDGECDRLLVLKGDLPVPPATLTPLADHVISWVQKQGVAAVVGLDAFHADGPATSPMALVASNPAGQKVAHKMKKASTLEAGALMGINPALILRGNRETFPVVGVFAPLSEGLAEARAAVTLLEIVDPLVAHIALEPEVLAEKASEVEAALRLEYDQQERTAKKMEKSLRGYA